MTGVRIARLEAGVGRLQEVIARLETKLCHMEARVDGQFTLLLHSTMQRYQSAPVIPDSTMQRYQSAPVIPEKRLIKKLVGAFNRELLVLDVSHLTSVAHSDIDVDVPI